MAGQSPFNFERDIHESRPDVGFYADVRIPFRTVLSGAGASLGTTAGSTPYLASLVTVSSVWNFPIIRWRQDADNTKPIVFDYDLPGDYSAEQDTLELLVCARKANASATDENSTLGLSGDAVWMPTGDTIPYKTDAVKATPTAAVAAVAAAKRLAVGTGIKLLACTDSANANGFSWYKINFSKTASSVPFPGPRRPNNSEDWTPLQPTRFLLVPDATVGTTTMTVDVASLIVRYKRNASLNNYVLRDNPQLTNK